MSDRNSPDKTLKSPAGRHHAAPLSPTASPAGKHADLAALDVTLSTVGAGRVVDGVSFSLHAGERLVIAGPNGAGKTSLLRIIAGQRKADEGNIFVRGRDLAKMTTNERARLMAVVGQNDDADQRLTVSDYVGLGRIPHSGLVSAARHRAIVAEALARVQLEKLADRQLALLSGGERQRAAIARAVAQEPAILLLDEPTNHLDLRARSDILKIVRNLGITVIAVLHDLALANAFADRVAVLRGGKLVSYGPVDSALSPAIVRDVFAMDCFSFEHPDTRQPLLVFDTPLI